MPEMVGQILAGRYKLEEPVATGGMGTVWRAHDDLLNRPVAVKILHDALAEDEKAAARFRREALTAAQIHHPNMAGVFDYVEEHGRPGIVMEMVEGETLAQRLARDKRIPADEAARIAIGVLCALEAAHRCDVVHRDVKPGNILLTSDGMVKVTDFGIARSLGDASLTATGTVMGTPHYSAPEQVRGESASPATDIYALGVVLYEMLTGMRPFEADTPIAVAMARLSDDPAPVREVRPDVPPALDAVVTRALRRDPADRFSSAAEMRAALASAADGSPGSTQIMPAISPATPSAETVGMRRAPHAVAEAPAEPSIIEELAPPPWMWPRLALVLVPLLIVAALGVAAYGMFGGADMVELPDLRGSRVAEAEQIAARLGLTIDRNTRNSDRARGTVLTQSPAAGEVEEGTIVRLGVSDGTCCKVPEVIGDSLEAATRAIQDAGLTVSTIWRQPSSKREGTVLLTNPAAGTEVNEAARVEIYVSRGAGDEGKGDQGKGGKGKGDD